MLAAGIAENHWPYFRRWLPFYLDFCQKYQQDSPHPSSLTAFDAKLQDKGQQPWKRQQAQQAIALYWTLLTNEDQPHTARETPHHTDAAATDTTAQPTNGPPPRVPSPPTVQTTSVASTQRRPAKSAQATCEKRAMASNEAPPTTVQSPQSPSYDSSTPTIPTDLNWRNVYDQLETAIKVRHYSAKTLGHSDVRTTMIYTHTIPSVTQKDAKSPLEL